jgi:ComF family protein
LRSLWGGFLQLLFPELCVACGRELPAPGACFCMNCRAKIAPSDMYLQVENEFTARFWGRAPLRAGAAMYYFARKSPVQRALHHLKYQNRPDVGVKLGREFGQRLKMVDAFKDIAVITAVPLHPKKERQRGYNQSAQFAYGLSEAMDIPFLPKALSRRHFTTSQTNKKRMERFENVRDVFQVTHPKSIEGRHVLLVDDVLTTGATLETCGNALMEAGCETLSMATIAIASR